MDRRQAVKQVARAAGGFSALPLLEPMLPAAGFFIRDEGGGGWALRPQPAAYVPKFFSSDELATLAVLCDHIMPTTNTPGARAAGVPEYLDDLLAASLAAGVNSKQTAAWKSGLAWLETHVQTGHGTDLLHLTPEQQVTVLTSLEALPESDPGRRFFGLLKDGTLYTYYTSKIGMEQELHYAMEYRDSYPGCTHPEHQS